MSKEEALRLPPLQQERQNEQWQRMRGGVHAQAVGVTLHTAARRGMLEVLEFLVSQDGVDVDVLDKVCTVAARLYTEHDMTYHSTIEEMLTPYTSKENMTALHYAGKRGNVKAIQLLLSLRASVNLRNSAGWTALAVAGDKGHTEVCSLLIAAKARCVG